MIQEITRYKCPTCDTEYENEVLAEACFNQTDPPRFEVGDIVTAGGHRYGWFNGDEAWIANRKPAGERGSASGEVFEFYYVVVAVEEGVADHGMKLKVPGLTDEYVTAHRTRYHLVTRAMTGEKGYSGGYTYNTGHLTPKKVENPPALPGLEEAMNERINRLL